MVDGDGGNMKPVPTIIQSRHLTKRQLSDMAWNVRKLSKKLGSIKLKLTVKNVFVVSKAYDESLVSLTRKVTRWLLSKDRDTLYNVYVEKRMETHPDFGTLQLLQENSSAKGRLKFWDPKLAQDQPHLFDFVVTLGGDGTVLYTSWLFQRIVPPVLSFALGSLGFLTNFDFADYQHILENAFRDGVVVSLRLRFECTIMRSKARLKDPHARGLTSRDLVEELIGEEGEDTLTHTPDRVYEILNDVVLDRGPNPSMFSTFLSLYDESCAHILTIASHVPNRIIWRRRALYHSTCRWNMYCDPDGFDSLQPRCWRFSVAPREPSDPRHCHLRAHTILPSNHSTRYHCTPDGCALRCSDKFLGQFRWSREVSSLGWIYLMNVTDGSSLTKD
jgi:NAD kinase